MIDILKQTGVFIYPLFVLFALGCVFFFERLFFLHNGQIRPENFLKGIFNLLDKQRIIEAVTLCEETPGAVARLVKVALVAFQNKSEKPTNAIKRQALLELPILRKRVESLRAMGLLASLLGLIGTVFFLLKGFWVLGSLQAYTQLTSFSPYILSALSVTFCGLLEMFLFYAAYHFLMGRVRALIFDMEWTANELSLFLEKEHENKQSF